ncbi:hypothetical protein RvY_10134-1 [Ramazzottius varieornatus]|uniref:Uncharacterized protein n=1 Tax=Ramazzottius varieornatus TaxID=947166 RepID=A0A1D1VDW5_RAMVA|nr:hypothetical protein RvY_10134-1 [Ramazzottius varieornatus]
MAHWMFKQMLVSEQPLQRRFSHPKKLDFLQEFFERHSRWLDKFSSIMIILEDGRKRVTRSFEEVLIGVRIEEAIPYRGVTQQRFWILFQCAHTRFVLSATDVDSYTIHPFKSPRKAIMLGSFLGATGTHGGIGGNTDARFPGGGTGARNTVFVHCYED